MERKSFERLYSERDINKAYIEGLECSVAIMEKVINLDCKGQREIIRSLEKTIRKYKIKAVISRMQISYK